MTQEPKFMQLHLNKYLTATRENLMYEASLISIFLSSPTKSH